MLKDFKNMVLLNPATEREIRSFETKNKITLPLKYKKWLQISDGGEFFGEVQMYGVAHKPLIDIEDDNKPNNKYIVIGALSSGDSILCEKGSEKISIFNSEADRIEKDEVYKDFFEFISGLYELLCVKKIKKH